MTTEKSQETPEQIAPAAAPASPANAASGSNDTSTDATKVGSVMDQLQSFTRRLNPSSNASGTSSRRTRSNGTRSLETSPERIQQLIQALGDPQHSDHAAAVELLVQIGSPALPYLIETLNTGEPWLAAYRSAEALGYLADGRSTGALIRALRHPNSNVRWSAVRSLSMLGDFRAVFELRRVANEDVGRTSWGESVASTAQSALDHLRAKSAVGQTIELIKTAITAVLMILALVLALSFFEQLRDELAIIGRTDIPENVVGVIPPTLLTPQPTATATPEVTPTPLPIPTPAPPPVILGTALQVGNVRLSPSVDDVVIGLLNENDEVIFRARDVSGEWYLIQLGERRSVDSFIETLDGTNAGWVSSSLLSAPTGTVPVFDENFDLTPLNPDADPSEAADDPNDADPSDTDAPPSPSQ
ncbi:MAG: SH3 domain-containing protein [Chloroflexaceae bacterium]|nr:SH3 domain-containing protein [Chloroflexaceae bacterium]